MNKKKNLPEAPIIDLVLCLSEAVDLVSPLVADHHRRTAQVAFGLATQMRLPEKDIQDVVIAAALHDVGGLTLQDRLDALDFEFQDPYGHAVRGYLLLRSFPLLKRAADFIRFHHVPWNNGQGAELDGMSVLKYSHLLHLADRIAVLINPEEEILDQVSGIRERISAQAGTRFVPEMVEAFDALSRREAFWLDAVYYLSLNSLRTRLRWPSMAVTDADFYGLSNIFRRIIDFRSPFTSSHSAGVAACAAKLGRLCGFTEVESQLLNLAGLLHDLGKLAIPAEILEKKGRLTPEELNVMHRHTYYTFKIMETLQILDLVRVWAAYHHERLDGQGYPFQLKEVDLPLGSRIVSVADIFTALTEQRPYRDPSSPGEALRILEKASAEHKLDQQVVEKLAAHLDEMAELIRKAQETARQEYQEFLDTAQKLTPVVEEERSD